MCTWRGYTRVQEEGGHLEGYIRGGTSDGIHRHQSREVEDEDAITTNELF